MPIFSDDSSRPWDALLRTFFICAFFGGVCGLWCLGLSEALFAWPASRLQAVLLGALYFPVLFFGLAVVFWSRWYRPNPTAQNPDWMCVVMAFAVLLPWAGSYYAIDLMNAGRRYYQLHTWFDQVIPMIPWTALVYVTVQWFVFVSIVVSADSVEWRKMLGAYISLVVVCTLCFWLFPVSLPVASVPVTSLSTWTISLIRSTDVPGNCFPSSHCAMALLSAFFLFHKHRWLGILGLFSAFSIAVSTLTTKQHYIADVIVGFALAGLSYWLWFRVKWKSSTES